MYTLSTDKGLSQMFVATRYATHQKVEFKCYKLHSFEWSLFIVERFLWIKDIFII